MSAHLNPALVAPKEERLTSNQKDVSSSLTYCTMSKHDKQRAKDKRKLINEYKINQGCKDCGYNLDYRALEFDHIHNNGRPYTRKQRTIASYMYHSLERIFEEISKCEVVCCNCHAIRTHKRREAQVLEQKTTTT